MKTVLLGLILASSALSINRIRRDGKADLSGAPRIISEVGSSNSGEIKVKEFTYLKILFYFKSLTLLPAIKIKTCLPPL